MVNSETGATTLPPAVLLMGPTAAGKTSLALALARRFPVSLISVDSAQVYRGLDIGSAKLDADTLAEFPHALIDIREPENSYSAADFVQDCELAMRRAAAAGQVPLLVGGTMMYYRAVIYGLDALPSADAALRAAIDAEASEKGWSGLHAELSRHDPVTAAAIRPGDSQRISRALEILRLTGIPPSRLRRHNRIPRFEALRLVVTPDRRHILHQRIKKRFNCMMQQGFLDEVEQLRGRTELDLNSAAMRSVGYRQAWQVLAGQLDRSQLEDRVLAATRQLAKRQLTALRQMTRSLWYDPDRRLTIGRIYRQVEGFSGWRGKIESTR